MLFTVFVNTASQKQRRHFQANSGKYLYNLQNYQNVVIKNKNYQVNGSNIKCTKVNLKRIHANNSHIKRK